ncbi:MAG: beta-galactosidase trimerization domain-containing protein [Desulfobacteraceae bacterium]|nr:beta-galactosidase trimerization domain-containing protein [Desulfobacteraceae bacterium]
MGGKNEKKWFQESFRRNLVDMHIEDWDERFLSEYDPEKYVEMLTTANVNTAMIYANSHVGLCYWPTKSGQMHKNLKGRDILGEVINLCHGKGMSVVVYYTLTFVNRAYEQHPEWRIITPKGEDGKGSGLPRYGICCLNTPYRDFALEQVKEIVNGYRFEGIWFDMTFWPEVCYCPSCKKRFLNEVGKEIPRTVNWENPEWVQFQRKREEWLAEFALLFTSTAKNLNPDLTVAHQSNTFIWDWKMGPSVELARALDYMSADLYGNNLDQSFSSKFFYNLSENLPFEYMTSRCPHLFHHTVMKPIELLEAQAFSALTNGAGFQFIDAIDPVGTLDKRVYKQMGDIYKEIERYEKFLGGDLCQDVGIYVSFESRFYPEDNNKDIEEVNTNLGFGLDLRIPIHTKTARSYAKALLNNNIPYGVITKKNLSGLSHHKIIILPDVLVMDHEEIEALKDFVEKGGGLFVTREAARIRKDGTKEEDFLLSELLGVSYKDKMTEFFTYIAPTDEGKELLHPYTPKYPLGMISAHVKVEEKKGTKILGTLTLPYTHPGDPDRFASIHSNPPGVPTEYPSIVMNKYGKGKVIYVAVNLDLVLMEDIFLDLLNHISPEPFNLRSDAPKQVELTLFHQRNKNRYIVNLLNFQSELPNIPVEGIEVKVKLEEKKPIKVLQLPDEKELDFEVEDSFVIFTAPRLETFLMVALDYEWVHL